MKKVLNALAFAIFLVSASCGENNTPDKESGDEQVPAPVTNSGAETEAERATNAVKDSNRDDNKQPDKKQPDTPRTTVSVGKDGGSVSTKSGEGVAVDRKGVKVRSKKVAVDIKRDSL